MPGTLIFCSASITIKCILFICGSPFWWTNLLVQLRLLALSASYRLYITFPGVYYLVFLIIILVEHCETFGYYFTLQGLGLYGVFYLAYKIACLFYSLAYTIHSLLHLKSQSAPKLYCFTRMVSRAKPNMILKNMICNCILC